MFDIRDELAKLPEKPGVYIMKDQNGGVIYVGKAIVLKNRVRQYFQSPHGQSPKVRDMVSRICEFEYIVTASELEALILESNLIAKYKPVYNIIMKYGRRYPYIKITMNEEYPRILVTRIIEKDGAVYYGPYSNATAVRHIIGSIKKIFPLKSCKKIFPRDAGKTRACLNYHLGQCLGPCQKGVGKEEYRELMKDIVNFLNGREDDVQKRLAERMKAASDNMEFEKAANLRDKLSAIRHIAQEQKVESISGEDQDVVAVAKGETDACVQVFNIRGGKLLGREHFILEGAMDETDADILASFIKQYYSVAAFIPSEIILQTGIDDADVIGDWLAGKKGAKVSLKVPQRGEKLRLVGMTAQNAAISLSRFGDRLKKETIFAGEGLANLAEALHLGRLPRRIEAYDISNTGSSEMVASMIVFEGGKPANSEYRLFRMKSVERRDDYACMQEAVFRRLRHARREQGGAAGKGTAGDAGDIKFARLPDLILVDGGTGHVNAIREVVSELEMDIPIYGMVKNDSHRTRGLAGGREEVDLSKNLPLLRFITAIQDEAHRFAAAYNKRLRSKRYTRSELDDIPGVGAARKKALISHFKSVAAIRKAGVDDLQAVNGISQAVAESIWRYFREREDTARRRST